MALALARKYRPKNFASVAVQSHVSNTLKGAIARGRVAHGYLLCGPRGTGKTTLARVLAMALNCERRPRTAEELGGSDSSIRRGASGSATGASASNTSFPAGLAGEAGEPCGECQSCVRIWSGGASLDVVEIDAASNRGVDDARDLRERAMYAPSGDGRYKVYIVDEAHMLTREAWNALLKILEEPPSRVVFVFATTEPQKIAQAAAPVLSRLQRFDLKRIGLAEIRERLAAVLTAEGVPFESEALGMIARAADGGLRDALSLTDQVLSLGAESAVTAERVREALGLVAEDEYIALLDLIAERRAGDVFSAVGRLADMGVDFSALLTGLADTLRAQLAVVLGGEPADISERARAALVERRDRLAAGDLLRMLHALGELEPRFRKSSQQQLLLETLLVRFALLDRTIDLEDVLRGLASGGEQGGRAGGGSARVPSTAPAGHRATALEVRAPAAPPPSPAATPYAAPSPPANAIDGRGAAPDAFVQRFGGGGESAAMRATPAAAPAAASAGPALEVAPPAAEFAPFEPPEDAAASVALRARSSPSRTADGVPDVLQVVDRWDDVVAEVHGAGRSLVASLLEQVLPVAVSGAGMLTLEVQDETAEQGLEAARDTVLGAVRALFPGVQRLSVRRAASTSGPPPAARRLTSESIRAERIASLRKRDPALGAAIDALDLELLD